MNIYYIKIICSGIQFKDFEYGLEYGDLNNYFPKVTAKVLNFFLSFKLENSSYTKFKLLFGQPTTFLRYNLFM